MKHCVNCGAELADEAKFCNKCGSNQEMAQQSSHGGLSQDGNVKPKKKSRGPLIAIIIIALILILGAGAVFFYLKKEQSIINTNQQALVEQEKDDREEVDPEEVIFDDPEELMEAYIAAIKDGDEEEIKALFEISDKNFSLEDYDILLSLKNKAKGEVEDIDIIQTMELNKSMVDEAAEDIEQRITGAKKIVGTAEYKNIDLEILEDVIRTWETFLEALKEIDSSELFAAEIGTTIRFGVDSDLFQSNDVEEISLVGLIHRTKDKGYVLLNIIYPEGIGEAKEARPAPEAGSVTAEAEAVPAAREMYSFLKYTSPVEISEVEGLVKKIDTMRVSTDRYVTEGAEYVLIGDVTNREVIYCSIGMSDSEMKALMEENGYYEYSVQYYFPNPSNDDPRIILEAPSCAHLLINGKEYWYYFAENSLIRRKAPEAVTDNPESNGFISEIYRMGHDFAESILYQFGDYIIPDSDTRRLNAEELQGMSSDDLKLASNEIYARHGRKFKDPDIQEYFNNRSWYYGTIESDTFSDSMLNQIEKDNVETINSVRNQME